MKRTKSNDSAEASKPAHAGEHHPKGIGGVSADQAASAAVATFKRIARRPDIMGDYVSGGLSRFIVTLTFLLKRATILQRCAALNTNLHVPQTLLL